MKKPLRAPGAWVRAALALLLVPALLARGETLLAHGDRLAIVGDSITEQRKYSKFMEAYLLGCTPDLDIEVFQFGWSGETAGGFLARMERDLLPWQPDVVTTCYGMNDGRYTAYNDSIGAAYEENMRRIIERLSAEDITVVVGSPGVVGNGFNGRGAEVYNHTLAQLAGKARALAREYEFPFADVYTPMQEAMRNAQAAYGEGYHVAGADGVHPAENGHLVMAYAFLRSLGFNGDIGTLTVTWGESATGSAGHTVRTTSPGVLEVESTRYPFCLFGNPRDPRSTRGILPFVPFQEELNRFALVVRNLPEPRATVRWGGTARTFTREQLAGGINLAAEFLDNPFSRPFSGLLRAVARKQQLETRVIKGSLRLTPFRMFNTRRPFFETERDEARRRLLARRDDYLREAREAVKPVRHRIEILPLPGVP